MNEQEKKAEQPQNAAGTGSTDGIERPKELTFSANWNNKLFGSIFSTIRLQNPEKWKIGDVWTIKLKSNLGDVTVCTAEVIDVVPTEINSLTSIACIDTGLSLEQTKKMFREWYQKYATPENEIFLHYIVFRRISPSRVFVKKFEVSND